MELNQQEIADKLRNMIVERLSLKDGASDISYDQPLFGPENKQSLGLDSVEALEIVVGIEEIFGVRIENSEGIEKRFYSIATLAEFVKELAENQVQDCDKNHLI